MESARKIDDTPARKPLSPKADRLFDNLIPMDLMVSQISVWLKREVTRATVYRWVRQGMPSQRIRGLLYFVPDEVALWLRGK
jgi:hypothetical protein